MLLHYETRQSTHPANIKRMVVKCCASVVDVRSQLNHIRPKVLRFGAAVFAIAHPLRIWTRYAEVYFTIKPNADHPGWLYKSRACAPFL